MDRLFPFSFNIEHKPGTKMGLVDYISRNPLAGAKKLFAYDEQLVVATISKFRHSLKQFIQPKSLVLKKT